MKTPVAIGLMVMFVTSLHAQYTFERIIGQNSPFFFEESWKATAVEVLPDSNFMIVGDIYDYFYGGMLTLKLNTAGDSIGGDMAGFEGYVGGDLRQLPDGNLLTVGTKYQLSTDCTDEGWLFKLNSDGKIIQVGSPYPAMVADQCSKLAYFDVLTSGEMITSPYYFGMMPIVEGMNLCWLDSDLTLTQPILHNWGNQPFSMPVLAGPAETVLVAGTYNGDVFLLKTNRNGDTIWNVSFSQFHEVYDLITTTDSGYVVIGASTMNSPKKGIVAKVDANGGLQWKEAYHIVGDCYLKGVAQTPDGGFICAGYNKLGAFSLQAWLMKVDDAGNMQWSHVYKGDKEFFDVKLAKDSAFIAVGRSYRNLPDDEYYDMYILKTDQYGCLSHAPIVSSLDSLAWGDTVQLSFGGNATNVDEYLWSTGASTASIDVTMPGAYALQTTDVNGCIAFSDTVVIHPKAPAAGLGTLNADRTMEVEVYPNPSNGRFTINIKATPYSDLQLKVLDVLGQERAMLLLRSPQPAQKIALEGLEAGIYFLNICNAEGQVLNTQRLVIQ